MSNVASLRVLVTGAAGQLGAYVLDTLAIGGHRASAWSHSEHPRRGEIEFEPVDLESRDLAARLDQADPDAVLHLGAVSSAEAVRLDLDRGRRVNVDATKQIAEWCTRADRALVYTSTDLVFDGSKPWSREDDPANPVLAYGRTKREAEPFVLACPRGLVTRVCLLYGFSRSGRPAYFDRTVAALRAGEPQTLFEDEFRTPLDLETAALALVRLAELGATGLVHVGGRERVSRYDLSRRTAIALGLDASLVRPNRQADVRFPEPRPADVSLDTTRLATLLPDLKRPTIEEALSSFVFPGEWDQSRLSTNDTD